MNILIIDNKDTSRQYIATSLSTKHEIQEIKLYKPELNFLDVPNLILLDIKQVTYAKEIIERFTTAKVVLIVATHLAKALDLVDLSKFSGVLFKESEPDKILWAVSTVIYGLPYYDTRTWGYTKLKNPLSDREKQVLRLAAQGHTNFQIAVRLNLAESTVKSYFQNIATKLNTRTKTQSVAVSIRHHFLDH